MNTREKVKEIISDRLKIMDIDNRLSDIQQSIW